MITEHLSMIKKLKMISEDGYLRIYDAIKFKAPCNFLVFGVGRDTELWLSVNNGGNCLFLEDSGKWMRTLQREYNHLGKINMMKVKYNSDVREASSMLEKYKNGNTSIFDMNLPDEVINTKWDVILVDGPFGKVPKEGEKSSTGRMKSIYAVYELLKGFNIITDVFIHDCEREVESSYCDFFFGDDFEIIDNSLRVYKL